MEIAKRKKSRSKNNGAATVLGIILCAIFGSMLACNLVIIIKGTLYPEMPPSVAGITPMVVMSGSMSGTQEGHIEVGDLIFTKSADPEELETGDVIAYMSGGVTVTHRITKIESGEDGLEFTTKGDANDSEDTSPVTESQLVGVYMGRIPKAGDFALFLQKPAGMLLFVGVPLFCFIVYDIVRRQKLAARETRRTEALEAEIVRLHKLTGEERPRLKRQD